MPLFDYRSHREPASWPAIRAPGAIPDSMPHAKERARRKNELAW